MMDSFIELACKFHQQHENNTITIDLVNCICDCFYNNYNASKYRASVEGRLESLGYSVPLRKRSDVCSSN